MRTPVTVLLAAALSSFGCASTPRPEPAAPAPQPTARTREPVREADSEDTGGMVIEGQLGYLSEAQLNRVLRPATPQLAACYNERLADQPYLEGHIELKIRIGADGTPLWVLPLRSTLGDRATEQCMIDRAMALRFPRPRGGETETTFPLDLEGGDDARPAVAWPASRLDRVVAQRRAALQQCTSGMTGPFELTVYAAPRGTVAAAGVGVSNPAAAAAVDCLVREATSWRVPDPGSWYAKTTLRLE
jgi:hypothetical protein